MEIIDEPPKKQKRCMGLFITHYALHTGVSTLFLAEQYLTFSAAETAPLTPQVFQPPLLKSPQDFLPLLSRNPLPTSQAPY